jgi:hypothetical protein
MRKPFLESLASYLVHEQSEGLEETLVILPNRRAGLFLQRHLGILAGRVSWVPEIRTISDFVVEMSGLTVTDPVDALFTLYEVYCGLREEPEGMDEFYHWGESLITDFDEIDKYMVDPGLLFRNIRDLRELTDPVAGLDRQQVEFIRQFWESFHQGTRTSEKKLFLETWELLPGLYEGFRERLARTGQAYQGMLYREVAERIHAGRLPGQGRDRIIVAGFNALNTCERVIFRWLLRQDALFFWDYDLDYITDPSIEAGRFMRENLKEFPAKAELEDFRGMKDEREIRIFELPTDILQTKTAARIIRDALKEGPADCTDLAVVLCDEGLLIPMLHSLPGDTGEINVTMGYPLGNSPVASLVDALFRLQHNLRRSGQGEVSFYHQDVRSVLMHPYMHMAAESAEGGEGGYPLLNRIAKENLIQVSRSEFTSERELAVFRSVEEPEDLLPYLRQVFLILLDDMGPESSHTLQEVHREFIFRLLVRLNRLEEQLEGRPDLTLSLVERLLRKIIGHMRVPFEGEPLAGLQLMGILETRLLDFKHVILLSMNEEQMPASRFRQSSVPYSLRLAFGMPSREVMDAISSYYFYRLLQRSGHVDLLYNSTSEGTRTGEMSRYLHQLVYRYGKKVIRPGMEVLAREREEVTVEHTEEVGRMLEKYISREGNVRFLSPSAVNAYLDCSLRFFLRYLCGIGETDEVSEDIDAPGFGTVVHGALKILYGEIAGNEDGLISREALERLSGSARLREVLRQEFIMHHFKGRQKAEIEGRNIILFRVMEQILEKILATDLAIAPFRLLATEKKYTRECIIRTASGEKVIRLGGYIDRVDRVRGSVRVIDYKTGSAGRDFSSLESLFDGDLASRNGAALQTLLYAWLVGQEYPGEQITPGLYAVKSLYEKNFDPSLMMGDRGNKQQVAFFADLEREYLEHLRTILERMFDPSVAFVQTEHESLCRNCDFAALCSRQIMD